jgi:hypothetical protein
MEIPEFGLTVESAAHPTVKEVKFCYKKEQINQAMAMAICKCLDLDCLLGSLPSYDKEKPQVKFWLKAIDVKHGSVILMNLPGNDSNIEKVWLTVHVDGKVDVVGVEVDGNTHRLRD